MTDAVLWINMQQFLEECTNVLIFLIINEHFFVVLEETVANYCPVPQQEFPERQRILFSKKLQKLASTCLTALQFFTMFFSKLGDFWSNNYLAV